MPPLVPADGKAPWGSFRIFTPASAAAAACSDHIFLNGSMLASNGSPTTRPAKPATTGTAIRSASFIASRTICLHCSATLGSIWLR